MKLFAPKQIKPSPARTPGRGGLGVWALAFGALVFTTQAVAQAPVAGTQATGAASVLSTPRGAGATVAVATVVSATGDSALLREAALVSPIRAGATLTAGDRVQTRVDGRVEMRFTDGSVVALQPNSDFRIDDYRLEAGEQRNFMSLLRGALRTVSGAIGRRQRDDYRLTTPSAVIGIRGTEYEVNETVCPARGCEAGVRGGLYVRVFQGRVSVTNDTGSVEVPTGAAIFVADRQSLPTLPRQPAQSSQPSPPTSAPAFGPGSAGSAPAAPPLLAPPAPPVPSQPPSPWAPSGGRSSSLPTPLSSAAPPIAALSPAMLAGLPTAPSPQGIAAPADSARMLPRLPPY